MMATTPPLTTKQLREEIRAALSLGTLTESEILQMVSTAEPPAAANGRAPVEPATDADDLPIYTELPEGLIDLPTARKKYGCTRDRFANWVRQGQIEVRGRLRAPAKGGGYLVVSEAELEHRLATVSEKGGRPRKIHTTIG